MFRLLTVFVVLFLSACSTGNLTAIHKRTEMAPKAGKAQGVFIDAEQRAVLSVQRPARYEWRLDPSGTYQWVKVEDPRQITCAEPSPDALSAIAAQAGASVSEVSTALSAQGGISETAASIGLRTQTIQILRDGYYRLCEAQMNGLPDVQYAMMLRRFQTQMIALLAIEQLTGAVKGSDAVVSAAAGSALNMKEVYSQRAALASAEVGQLELDIAAEEKKVQLLKEANTKCQADAAKQSAGCSVADGVARGLEIAEIEATVENLKRRKVHAQAMKESSTAMAAAAVPASDARGGGFVVSPLPPAAAPRSVADAVTEIALAMIEQDYGTQMCLEYLREGNLSGEDVETACKGVVAGYAQQFTDRATSRANAEKRLDEIWAAVLKDGKIDATEVEMIKMLSSAVSPGATPTRTNQGPWAGLFGGPPQISTAMRHETDRGVLAKLLESLRGERETPE
ncbi:hypothetical protein [Hyphomonas polymorpha]|nr:hypothetical protein [Hyphomonas polymorpha]